MTHVFVDARNITDEPGGVARYAQSLIPRLIEQQPSWRWTILRHSSNNTPIGALNEVFVDMPIDGIANYRRGARLYRRAFAEHGTPDVVHSLFHLLPRNLDAELRVVVTAHDFIWIDHPEISQSTRLGAFAIRSFAGRAIPYALRRANRVIAVSEATASRAAQWVNRSKVDVVAHGVEPRYFEPPPPPDPIVEFLLRDDGQYVVTVGNDKRYKNLQTLLRAFAQLESSGNLRLVLVGRCEGLMPLAEQLGIAGRTIPVGFLDDVDLRRVVGHATAFVFPSTVEGFGLPPLEAMALGVPTIVSALPPMSEVAGVGALTFQPTDVGALAELLSLVLRDNALRSRMREAGLERARNFDWDVTAKRTIELYRELKSRS